MLKTLDILLGLSVVMLMVSLVVTVLTQAVTNLLQTRGKNLLDGVAGLLKQIHRDLPEEACRKIAEAILTHPLIKAAGSRYGTVIHREELTILLLQLASDEGPQRLEASLRIQLLAVLRENGIQDPEKTLDSVRSLALQLEQAHPELSNDMRHSMALLQEANSRFLAKINGWFDQTIDRVADRFTNSARLITFCGSVVVALFLQLDTVALVNRLSEDPAFRQALVEEAIKVNQQAGQRVAAPSTSAPTATTPAVRAAQPNAIPQAAGDAPVPVDPTAATPADAGATGAAIQPGATPTPAQPAPATTTSPATTATPAPPPPARPLIPSLTDADKENLRTLAKYEIIDIPPSVGAWFGRWTAQNFIMKLLGILLTAMLLSLGAPFWYNALKNLIKLRSVLAQKDDVQRDSRQAAAPGSSASAAVVLPVTTPATVAGERGDLTSVG